ncbi:exodeoxyribonuclease V subunit alpha [Mycolicibacterium thermoresistibile]|jgi:exodeoxyribonuclease V alpha subunit|uniref:RecBCD enzyme subunit RecD n=2 Tax=Mycolicibacterium thermoresistibile TaxID=1797 RepID=G7CKJ7_MYCT3|nr:exodeoxyribonuclease V subunit alpha [Mycolicibacterium thermoresistibile]EHI11707.1 DNA helicase/exodeoxyribonuclease V subunit alpha [Mycolicibacterium thermoresistibile ATCC 19527]MCV7187866.1 exodeoxyribonuclease V subunit alpha [Mycolicibacterium thermoresistibile]GAT16004.1 exonuclease V alpha subunit recD [Mycolicibacterium thermoresistibile]SNW17030.1 exodeoxyribonuclease V subunit alpha [Mycolicibacterium thermoresistibile]
MSAPTEIDALSWRFPVGADGLLREFAEAGVIETADVQVARRLCELGGEPDERVALAVALVVRALRGGSVCVDLSAVAGQIGRPELPWPSPSAWLDAVAASPLVTASALRVDGRLVYLDRYWREEQQVCEDVLTLVTARPPGTAPASERLFPAGYEEQRAAADVALSQGLTVLTGGPGTGKTTTVARLLALIAEQAAAAGRPPLRIALSAPTGKAAARLQEAVQLEVDRLDLVDRRRLSGLQATTLHRLLGPRPDSSSRFRHHRANRLPHDVIVVDETSMVSLTMMARLLEAVRPDARVLLVGDPDQLASVEAGAVLADLVDGLSARSDTRVAALLTSHRFGESIGALAAAIRAGDADAVVEVLRAGGEHIEWVDTEEPAEALRAVVEPHALRLRQAAVLGDRDRALAALDEHRLLCAHRRGPYGVTYWNRQTERWLSEATGEPIWSAWYVGRPVLVTANDYGLRLYNGDTGVTVAGDDGLRAVIAGAAGRVEFATSRLSEVDTMHAMTIHKSQGSQADEVTVLLPPEDSRLLSRELFYTAVTRAKSRVRIVGPEASLRQAVRHRVVRASGLARRLSA